MSINRREFLKLAGVAAGSLYFSSNLGWAMPQAPQGRGKSKGVVILGAGLAGLAAGWELRNAGHEVIILEAQLHPGGRVHTIREGLSDDLYAEAGAGRIPNTHSITREWVNHFGLELEPFFPSGSRAAGPNIGSWPSTPRDSARPRWRATYPYPGR